MFDHPQGIVLLQPPPRTLCYPSYLVTGGRTFAASTLPSTALANEYLGRSVSGILPRQTEFSKHGTDS